MKVIRLRDAQAMIGEIVAEVGKDYNYVRPKVILGNNTCLYWHKAGKKGDPADVRIESGEPGCIVGRLLHKAGMSPQAINSLDGKGSIASACGVLPEHGIRLTERAVMYLQQVQKEQDSGHTWAESAAYARGWLESSEFAGPVLPDD